MVGGGLVRGLADLFAGTHTLVCPSEAPPGNWKAVYKRLTGLTRYRTPHVHGCWTDESISTLQPCSLGTVLSMWKEMTQEQLYQIMQIHAMEIQDTERMLRKSCGLLVAGKPRSCLGSSRIRLGVSQRVAKDLSNTQPAFCTARSWTWTWSSECLYWLLRDDFSQGKCDYACESFL